MRTYLLVLVVVALVGVVGCKDSPVSPDPGSGNPADTTHHTDTTEVTDPAIKTNLLVNSAFLTSNTSTRNLDATSAPPWITATGSPQIGAGLGADNTHGFMQMWGNAEQGESVMQALQTPIRKGKTYILTADVKFMHDNPANYNPFARVRFVAFNDVPGSYGRWQENKPNVSVIGAVQTSVEAWQNYTVEWTADADYHSFAFNVEDDIVGDNSACWAHIDNVTLTEK